LHDFLPKLEAALDAADVACLIIAAPEGCSDDALSAVAKPLIDAAQRRDAAALLAGRPELAKLLEADGVHLDLRTSDADDIVRHYRYARKMLGPDLILGVQAPVERHAALEVAEDGADYVGFDLGTAEAEELLSWWGEMMTVPCVAFGGFNAEEAGRLAAVGADFLAPDPKFWQATDSTTAIAAIGRALTAGRA
jgi:thiamine-phosphate pyrophosphorylase